jgi:Uma2 family endonuclease
MNTVAEVRYALSHMTLEDRHSIACWLEGYQEHEPLFLEVREPAMKDAEEPMYMSEEEYLQFEENSPTRHEYVNGYVHAMSGASMAHNRIVSRLHTALANRLGNGPCETFMNAQKLKVDTESDKDYYYPDIMVTCDTSGWRDLWLLNPRLIVEVLSPSTQHIDRREKASTYRKIESMEEYVIAAQSSWRLTIFRRADGWVADIVSGPDAVAEFRSLGVSVPLAEIYRGVFPESASAGSVGAE